MPLYEQGALHKSESGQYWQLSGDEWVPYKGITPDQTKQAQERATNLAQSTTTETPYGPYTTGTPGLLEAVKQGLQQGLGGDTLGWLPQGNQDIANRQAVSQEFPLATSVGKSIPAVVGSAIAPMTLPAQVAVGAGTGYLSDGSEGALIGGAINAIAPGISAMASRMWQQTGQRTAQSAQDSWLRTQADRLAPSYSGFNQTVQDLNQVVSKEAAKIVGLGGDTPLTSVGLIEARAATKKGYDDLIAKAESQGVPPTFDKNSIKASIEDVLVDAGHNETAIKSVMRQVEKAMPNTDFAGFGDLHRMQSQIGKMANDAIRAGKTFKGQLLDDAHTGIMNMLEANIPKELSSIMATLRNQYRNQSVLMRSGIVGEQGQVNIPTLLNATIKTGTDDLTRLRNMAAELKDAGGVRTSSSVATDITKRGLGAGLVAVVGGMPWALLAGAMEPAVAWGVSRGVRAIAGEGAMSARVRSLAKAQEASKQVGVGVGITGGATGASRALPDSPSGIPVSPNAGKFGQGGGIGGFRSGLTPEQRARKAERAAMWKEREAQAQPAVATRVSNNPAGRPLDVNNIKTPSMERPDFDPNVGLVDLTPEQLQYAQQWVDLNPRQAVKAAQQQPTVTATPKTVFEGAAPTTYQEKATAKAQLDAIIKQGKEEVKHLSGWQQDQVKEQVKQADRMLKKLNKNSKGKTPYDRGRMSEFVKE